MKFDLKRYVALGVTLLCVTILGIIIYFCIGKYEAFINAVKALFGIISPFIYGGALAYVLSPLCNKFEAEIMNRCFKNAALKTRAKKISERLAILLAYIFLAIIIYIFMRLVMPQVIESLKSIINIIPEWITTLYGFYLDIAEKYPDVGQTLNVYVQNVYNGMNSFFQSGELLNKGMSILSSFSTSIVSLVNNSINVIVALIASMYMLASRKTFKAQFKKFIYAVFKKNIAEAVIDELRFVDMSFSGFIIGKIIDSFIIGIIALVVLNIMKMPYAALLAMIIGVTNIIPFFGPIVGAIPGVILILFTSPIKTVYFIIFVFCLQQFDGNILGPKILGDKVGIPSFWVLFSIIVFGSIWGFIGMIIGVPLFAVIMDITAKFVNRRLSKKGMPYDTESYMSGLGEEKNLNK